MANDRIQAEMMETQFRERITELMRSFAKDGRQRYGMEFWLRFDTTDEILEAFLSYARNKSEVSK